MGGFFPKASISSDVMLPRVGLSLAPLPLAPTEAVFLKEVGR